MSKVEREKSLRELIGIVAEAGNGYVVGGAAPAPSTRPANNRPNPNAGSDDNADISDDGDQNANDANDSGNQNDDDMENEAAVHESGKEQVFWELRMGGHPNGHIVALKKSDAGWKPDSLYFSWEDIRAWIDQAGNNITGTMGTSAAFGPGHGRTADTDAAWTVTAHRDMVEIPRVSGRQWDPNGVRLANVKDIFQASVKAVKDDEDDQEELYSQMGDSDDPYDYELEHPTQNVENVHKMIKDKIVVPLIKAANAKSNQPTESSTTETTETMTSTTTTEHAVPLYLQATAQAGSAGIAENYSIMFSREPAGEVDAWKIKHLPAEGDRGETTAYQMANIFGKYGRVFVEHGPDGQPASVRAYRYDGQGNVVDNKEFPVTYKWGNESAGLRDAMNWVRDHIETFYPDQDIETESVSPEFDRDAALDRILGARPAAPAFEAGDAVTHEAAIFIDRPIGSVLRVEGDEVWVDLDKNIANEDLSWLGEGVEHIRNKPVWFSAGELKPFKPGGSVASVMESMNASMNENTNASRTLTESIALARTDINGGWQILVESAGKANMVVMHKAVMENESGIKYYKVGIDSSDVNAINPDYVVAEDEATGEVEVFFQEKMRTKAGSLEEAARKILRHAKFASNASNEANVTEAEPAAAPAADKDGKDGKKEKPPKKITKDDQKMFVVSAVKRGDSGALQIMINAGVDVTFKDRHGQSMLHLAAASGHRDDKAITTLQILAQEIDINVLDGSMQTPFDRAANSRIRHAIWKMGGKSADEIGVDSSALDRKVKGGKYVDTGDPVESKKVTEQRRMRDRVKLIENIVRTDVTAIRPNAPVAEYGANVDDALRKEVIAKYERDSGMKVDPESTVLLDEKPFGAWMDVVEMDYNGGSFDGTEGSNYWQAYVDPDAVHKWVVAGFAEHGEDASDMSLDETYEFWEEQFKAGQLDGKNLDQFFDAEKVTRDLEIEGSIVAVEINGRVHSIKPEHV